jgi:PAS domain S-box-containing protein
MRIKTQFLISIISFSVILIIIGTSVAATQQQIIEFNNQETLAHNIQTGASDLNYISNNYFLYQDNSYINLWQTKFSTLSDEIATLNSNNPRQQALVDTVRGDLERLNTVFDGVKSYLANAPRNVSIRVLPSFQTQWNRMAVQIQALAFDSQQLSQVINDQTNQATLSNTILTVALLALFGAFFITSYLITYRKTLRSISKLEDGISVIGTGNLGHVIEAGKDDEIAGISKSVNQMAANLKTVTASKIELEQAQTSLMASEQRWATTLASIGDAVIATDTVGKIVFMNGEAEELTGWALSEASQKPVKTVFNIVNEQTRLEVENPVDRVLNEGVVVGLANHTVLIRKDRTEVPIDDSGAPIKDKDGKTTGVVLIFRDITERKKTDEAVARQAELIDITPDAIIITKIDGTIKFWSKGAEKLYGYTKEDVLGQNIHTLLDTKFQPSLEAILTQINLEGKWSGELAHTTKDGDKVAVQSYWLGKFGEDGKLSEIFESNVDVTERIRMQVKLEESATLLEEYANQMETLANQRAEQLKNAERLATIGATAGMVGHDIRNPLQAITSDVYLAKTELASTSDTVEKKNALESLDEIEKNIFYINKIVADLQDFARPLKPIPKETDLPKLIEEALGKNGVPENIKIQVKLKKDADTVMADPDVLKRILANLVTNAVQAMPDGGKISIKSYKEAKDLIITVTDTGIGIPEEVKDKLFTPLFTTKSKGQGFGLAVVKRMTEALGGTVTFESQKGKGTTFIIRLKAH